MLVAADIPVEINKKVLDNFYEDPAVPSLKDAQVSLLRTLTACYYEHINIIITEKAEEIEGFEKG